MGVCFKAKPCDNDLRIDIVDYATSTMEFNDCDDIVQADMLTFDDIVTIVEIHRHVNHRRVA